MRPWPVALPLRTEPCYHYVGYNEELYTEDSTPKDLMALVAERTSQV